MSCSYAVDNYSPLKSPGSNLFYQIGDRVGPTAHVIECIPSHIMRQIDPSHVKESIVSPVGDKLNTKNLLVVLECLKDRAFDSADYYASREVSCVMLTKVCL